jgi:hypothetical protein
MVMRIMIPNQLLGKSSAGLRSKKIKRPLRNGRKACRLQDMPDR